MKDLIPVTLSETDRASLQTFIHAGKTLAVLVFCLLFGYSLIEGFEHTKDSRKSRAKRIEIVFTQRFWRPLSVLALFCWLCGTCVLTLFPLSAHAAPRQARETLDFENSSSAPTLTQFNDGTGNALYVGWAGTDSPSHLNIIQSSDGSNFTNKQTLTDSTVDGQGVSLATFSNRLYVAFMGGENLGGCPPDVHSCGKVHLGFYRHSNSLGSGVVVNVNGVAQTTIARPTIAGFNGKIYIAWVGTDTAHHLNVASSTDGLNFGSKQTLTDTSFTSPYLTVFNNQLHLTFTGTTNNLVTGFFLDGNPTLQSHTTVGQTSPSEPGTASFGGKLYLGWQGADGAKSTNLAFAADGLHFSSPTHPSRAGSSSTEFGPGLGTFNGHLYYVWAAALLFPNIFTSLNLVQVA